MQDEYGFLKIQPSSGMMIGRDGKTIGWIISFRPDTTVDKKHWFKSCSIDHHFLCIETGSDGFPVNCKKIFKNSDGPNECGPLLDETMMKLFEFCCGLIANKNKDSEMQHIGNEILNDMLLGDNQ